MNSHSLEKLDVNFQHKTISLPSVALSEDEAAFATPLTIDNPEFLGKSIMETFLEKQPYNIQSMITQS